MNAKDLKSAIMMCANRRPTEDISARCVSFVCSLSGALSVVGDLEMVNALNALVDLPQQTSLKGDQP